VKICHSCGGPLNPPRTLPLVLFSKTGVYAVDSVLQYPCPTEGCKSGGGYEEYFRIGDLADLAEEITERPLYAKQDLWGHWNQVPKPE